MKSLRRGQAEIVGGLIVVAVLLLIVFPLIINVMTTSTIVSTRVYSARSQFEIDRASEKLQLNVDAGGTYRLSNVGPVNIEVVRVWYTNGSLTEFTPWRVIAVGDSIPITELGVTDLQSIDVVVTSRGRVFRIAELIPPPTAPPTAPTLLEAIAKNITLGYYLVTRYNRTYGINASYSTDGTRWSTAYVAHHNGTHWLVFNETTCSWVVRTLTITPSWADLDSNNISELILLDRNYELVSPRTSTLSINLTLYRCGEGGFISLTNETEILMTYFKFISRYNDVDAVTNVTIALRRVRDGLVYRNTAVFSRAMIRGAANIIIDIYQGYVIYPFSFTRGYGIAGDYNIELFISIDTGVSSVYVTINTEYIAIITYP